MNPASIPVGTVTFLFSDIEGSTPLWEADPDSMSANLERHDALIRGRLEAHGGYVFKTVGDEFCCAFANAPDALLAAIDVQSAVQAEPWRGSRPIAVRMALHCGAAQLRDGDYFGAALSRVRRIQDLGYGGQVLLSETATDLVRDVLPAGASLSDMGTHALRGLSRGERVFQLGYPGLRSLFPPLKSTDVHPSNLPRLLSSFVGRQRDEAEVREILAGSRLVTLTGPGGCGKTRLALEVATSLAAGFEHGAWLVELNSISDPALVVAAVADVLDVREQAAKDREVTLQEFLADKHILLVLDNCEHLIDECARLIGALLQRHANLRVIATSREALDIDAERVWAVEPLAVPAAEVTGDIGGLGGLDSVRLFVERAQAAATGFTLTAANAPLVAHICRGLDGIPLALELAAARLGSMTIEDLADGLQHRFEILRGGRRDAQAHHRTLWSAIDWSYALLPEPEGRLFRRLAVFSGSWTAEAAASICDGGTAHGHVLEPLLRLVQKSLVRFSDGRGHGRYRMLESLHAFAAEKLAGSPEEESEIIVAHRRWYLDLAQRGEQQLRGAGQAEWLARLDQEQDNLRAAMRVAEADDPGAGIEIAATLGRFWSLHRDWSEGRDWLERLLKKAPLAPPPVRAKAMYCVALLAADQADFKTAQRMAEESMALFSAEGDETSGADAAVLLARASLTGGDLDSAARLLDESLAVYRRADDRQRLNAWLNNFGLVEMRRGNLAAARALFEESLALKRELSDEIGAAGSLHNLGILAAREGDLTAAAELQQQSLDIWRRLDERQGMAASLNEMAFIALRQEMPRVAAAHLKESLSHLREAHELPRFLDCLEAMAAVAAALDECEVGACLLGAVAALREARGIAALPQLHDISEGAAVCSREALGSPAFAAAMAKGAALDPSAAAAVARDFADRVTGRV